MKKEFDVDFELQGRRIRKVAFAETTKVDDYREIAEEFMEKIFGMKRGSYFISDASSLSDFRRRKSKECLLKKIKEVFGIDVSDVKAGNLAEIFERIDMKRAS